MFVSLRRALIVCLLLPLAACYMPKSADEYDSPAAGMTRLGNQMREKGDLGAAIDFYRRGLAKDPKNHTAIVGLASSLEQFGDKQAAVEAYREGIKQRPKDGELRRLYGRLLIGLDQPGEAKKQYEAALDIDSDDVKARSGLGVALDYLGDHKGAQKEYEKALKDDAKNLPVINNLAYSYILSRRYDKAIKMLEPHVSKPSTTAAMRQNLALAYGLAGMEADAERVARMDLPPEKVQANMDYYRKQRAEMAVTTAPYVELGTYATEGMAIAEINRLRPHMEKTGGDLKPTVLPEVTAPGGTPRFTVRMLGCSRPDDISRLCATLAKSGIPCNPRGKGGE